MLGRNGEKRKKKLKKLRTDVAELKEETEERQETISLKRKKKELSSQRRRLKHPHLFGQPNEWEDEEDEEEEGAKKGHVTVTVNTGDSDKRTSLKRPSRSRMTAEERRAAREEQRERLEDMMTQFTGNPQSGAFPMTSRTEDRQNLFNELAGGGTRGRNEQRQEVYQSLAPGGMGGFVRHNGHHQNGNGNGSHEPKIDLIGGGGGGIASLANVVGGGMGGSGSAQPKNGQHKKQTEKKQEIRWY